MYELAAHHIDLLNLKININRVHELLSVPPAALQFVEIEGRLVLLSTLANIGQNSASRTSILSFSNVEGSSKFIETASFEVSSCATSLAASSSYLAVGCAASNTLSVFNLLTREAICTVAGPGSLFATDLAIFEHGSSALPAATVYASGVHGNTHYVS